jgi:hypothetical protein
LSQHAPPARITLALLLLFEGLLALPLAGQVNVEALRRDNPPVGVTGSLGGDLSVRTGNVDFVALDLRTRLDHVTDAWADLLIGNGGIGFLGRSRFSSSGLLHFRRTYVASVGPVAPEWYGQFNYDRSQLLTLRFVGGGGVRTSFARGEWGQFGAGSGVMLEHERLALPDTAVHPASTTALRWSNFLTLKMTPTETLVVSSTTYMQPDLGSFADYRALENLRISTSITAALSLTVSFDLRYDSRPPDGITGLDTSLRTGVTYTY